MIFNNIDVERIRSKAHAALDKKLNDTKAVSKTVKFNMDITEILDMPFKPVIFFTKNAQDKMETLVDMCDKEIAWHGLVKKEETDQGDIYTIYDIVVYPQVVTQATAVAIDDVGMWYMNQPDEIFNFIRMQGHSHVNMSVSPSVTDTTYYNNLLTQVNDYYIFMILNKRGTLHIELHDVVNGIIFEKNDLLLDYEEEESQLEVWAREQMETYLLEKDPNPVNKPEPEAKVGYVKPWYQLSMAERAELVGMDLEEYEEWYGSLEKHRGY